MWVPLEAQGVHAGNGIWGNFRIIQDTCRQCPHPVPCQLACPHGAIEVVAPLNARVVNVDKCVGCGICTQACPWDMMSLDKTARKATKCTLCNIRSACRLSDGCAEICSLVGQDQVRPAARCRAGVH